MIGWAVILLFGVALVVWPPLGGYVHAAVHAPLNVVLGLFRS